LHITHCFWVWALYCVSAVNVILIGLPTKCQWTAHKMSLNCSQNVILLLTKCHWTAHKMLFYCSQNAILLLTNCHPTAHKLSLDCSQNITHSTAHKMSFFGLLKKCHIHWTVHKMSLYCLQNVIEQSQNVNELSQNVITLLTKCNMQNSGVRTKTVSLLAVSIMCQNAVTCLPQTVVIVQ